MNTHNPSLQIEVGKSYIDNTGQQVYIKKVTNTGWYISDQSSYRMDGECYHGSYLNLVKEA